MGREGRKEGKKEGEKGRDQGIRKERKVGERRE